MAGIRPFVLAVVVVSFESLLETFRSRSDVAFCIACIHTCSRVVTGYISVVKHTRLARKHASGGCTHSAIALLQHRSNVVTRQLPQRLRLLDRKARAPGGERKGRYGDDAVTKLHRTLRYMPPLRSHTPFTFVHSSKWISSDGSVATHISREGCRPKQAHR